MISKYSPIPKPIPAIAYLRVSGVSQIDGDGFRRQEDKIRSWAKRNRYEIVAVFKEKAISGSTSELSERPALSELMLKIAGNGVRTVLVENATRFSRDLIAGELGWNNTKLVELFVNVLVDIVVRCDLWSRVF